MTAPYYHAKNSARLYKGKPEDYLPIHEWLDATKAHYGDARHRALRHHSLGIEQCCEVFGPYITNSDGKEIATRYIAEQHIIEDCGRIPSVADWLSQISMKPWMLKGTLIKGILNRKDPYDKEM